MGLADVAQASGLAMLQNNADGRKDLHPWRTLVTLSDMCSNLAASSAVGFLVIRLIVIFNKLIVGVPTPDEPIRVLCFVGKYIPVP